MKENISRRSFLGFGAAAAVAAGAGLAGCAPQAPQAEADLATTGATADIDRK